MPTEAYNSLAVAVAIVSRLSDEIYDVRDALNKDALAGDLHVQTQQPGSHAQYCDDMIYVYATRRTEINVENMRIGIKKSGCCQVYF